MKSITLPWATPTLSKQPSFTRQETERFSWLTRLSDIRKPRKALFLNLAKQLKWPSEVFTILDLAFKSGLTRHYIWDLQGIPANLLPAFGFAMGLFKRGVTSHTKDPFWSPLKTPAGECQIDIVSSGEALNSVGVSRALGYTQDQINSLADLCTVIDENILDLYASVFKDNGQIIVIEPTEKNKSWSQVSRILSHWLDLGSPKNWLIVGGGITSDIAMFAASLIGANVTILPTTLLSMIDASTGGKTGINYFPFGKNQIGTFYYPQKIVVAPKFLETLPRREILSGGAEGLKHAILGLNEPLAAELALSLKEDNRTALANLLGTLIDTKVSIVAQDSFETLNIRDALNMGHTLAHALEAFSQEKKVRNPIRHGEAVALGLVFDLLISEKNGLLSQKKFSTFMDFIKESGVLLSVPDLGKALGQKNRGTLATVINEFLPYLFNDKKNTLHSGNFANILWIVPTDQKDSFPFFKKVTITLGQAQSIWQHLVFNILTPK